MAKQRKNLMLFRAYVAARIYRRCLQITENLKLLHADVIRKIAEKYKWFQREEIKVQ